MVASQLDLEEGLNLGDVTGKEISSSEDSVSTLVCSGLNCFKVSTTFFYYSKIYSTCNLHILIIFNCTT